jgi:excisionase family DNA binding protein
MKSNTNTRLSYTIEEATAVTGMARTRIYRAIADGSLKTFMAGRRRMTSAKALESWIASLERASVGNAA